MEEHFTSDVKKMWVTILLKDWIDNNFIAATVVIGSASNSKLADTNTASKISTKHLSMKPSLFRMNNTSMTDDALQLRNDKKGRQTYNARLQFQTQKVFDMFPFEVYRNVCELELQGISGYEKYTLSVPSYEEMKKLLPEAKAQNNEIYFHHDDQDILETLFRCSFVSIKEEIFSRTDIIYGSQDIYVPQEITNKNEKYYPKVFIRLLHHGPTLRHIFLFYTPFTVLWIFAIIVLSSVGSNQDPLFQTTLASIILAIIFSMDKMIDTENWRQIALFQLGVLSYVLMLIPNFKYAICIPIVVYVWIPVSYIYYSLWLPKYTQRYLLV